MYVRLTSGRSWEQHVQFRFHLVKGGSRLCEEVVNDAFAELSFFFVIVHFEYLPWLV